MNFETHVFRILPTLAVGALCTAGVCTTTLADDEGSGFSVAPPGATLTVQSDARASSPQGGVAGAGCEYAVDDGTGEQNVGFGTPSGAAEPVLQGIGNTLVVDSTCTTVSSIRVVWGTFSEGSLGTGCTVSIYDDPNNDGDPSDAVLLGSGTGITANENTDIYNDYPLDAPVEVSGVFFIAAVAEVMGTPAGDFPMRNDRTAPDNGVSWFLANMTDPLNAFNSGGAVGINGTFGDFGGNCMIRAGGEGVNLCPTDIDGNGATDVDDLVAVILEWNCMGSCTADVNGDMMVNVDDLVAVILAWGPCPVANEACGDAIFSLTGFGTVFLGEISCDPVTLAFNNTGASLDGGPFECDETATADVWYEATFNCTGLAVIDTNGSDFDTVLEAYDACGGTLLGCDNDSGDDGLDSKLEIAVEPGTTLKIRVGGGALGSEGAGVLRLCCAENLPDPPTNDNCADAEALAVGGSDTEQTITASDDPEAFPCGVTVDTPGVWYAVTGTGNTMTASLCTDTDYDAKIIVYCGPCEELACIGGDDDGCGTVGGPSEISWCSEAAREYLVFVTGFGGATGNFTISLADDAVGCGAPDECTPNVMLQNDECIDAIPISNGLTEFSTLQATTSTVPAHGECQYDGLTVHDIWFTYTVDCPEDTGLLILSTCDEVGADGGFDTDIVAYDATGGIEAACADLANRVIGCNDDNCPIGAPAAPWYSHAEIPVTNGQELIIRLGGFGTEGLDLGEGTILIDCVAADDDLCAFAEVADLSTGSAEIQLDNCGATVDDLAPICGSSAPDSPGRWIAFLGTGSTVQIELCNTNNPGAGNNEFIDTRLNVYCAGFNAPNCGALECAAEEDVDNGNCPFTEITQVCTANDYWYVILVQGNADFGGGCEGVIDVTITELGSCNTVPCVQVGACCTDDGATCTSGVIDELCAQQGGDFYADLSCEQIECFVPCEPGAADTMLQQNYSDSPLGGIVRCGFADFNDFGFVQTDNWFYREFSTGDPSDPGVPAGTTNVLPNPFYVCSIDIALDDSAQLPDGGELAPLGIALYDVPVSSLTFDADGNTLNTPIIMRSFDPMGIGGAPADPPGIGNFEVGGNVDTGTLTVEVYTPNGADDTQPYFNSILQVAVNINNATSPLCPPQGGTTTYCCDDCGQAGDSYWRSPCGAGVQQVTNLQEDPTWVGMALVWKIYGVANP